MATRRRQQRQGCLLALLVLVGTIAFCVLVGVAIVGSSPLDGIARLVLGLALVAFNRAVAESGALAVIAFAGQPTSKEVERSDQPHWYSAGRLVVTALGLTLVVNGVMLLTGDTDFIKDAMDSLTSSD